MEDINYFKDMFNSLPYYRKIIFLCFIIKQDYDMLKEFGLSDSFIEKLYNDCKQIMESDMDQNLRHIKNLEESILEKISY